MIHEGKMLRKPLVMMERVHQPTCLQTPLAYNPIGIRKQLRTWRWYRLDADGESSLVTNGMFCSHWLVALMLAARTLDARGMAAVIISRGSIIHLYLRGIPRLFGNFVSQLRHKRHSSRWWCTTFWSWLYRAGFSITSALHSKRDSWVTSSDSVSRFKCERHCPRSSRT